MSPRVTTTPSTFVNPPFIAGEVMLLLDATLKLLHEDVEVVRKCESGSLSGQGLGERPRVLVFGPSRHPSPRRNDRLLDGHHAIAIGDETLAPQRRHDRVVRAVPSFNLVGHALRDLYERGDLDEGSRHAGPHDVASLGQDHRALGQTLNDVCSRARGGGGVCERDVAVCNVDEPVGLESHVALPPLRKRVVYPLRVGIVGTKAGHGITSVWRP
jgi:hypothetical protein